jgi:anthranilate phosphoribosyltransferase
VLAPFDKTLFGPLLLAARFQDPSKRSPMSPSDALSRAIHTLADGRPLSATHAEEAFTEVMSGEASPIMMAALLMGLRTKGETVDEVVGAVRALRGAMVKVNAAGAVDTCGTGGGAVGTFNISTAAALVAAGAGARVAKHGNRSFTSRSGSADVLEALGVGIPPDAASAEAMMERSGMTFLFAPLFHPAMKHVGPVRRELAMTTIMNVLGPLANPAGVRRQVVGVADPARGPLLSEALARLGGERAFVVHARSGMDEISPIGPTDVWEVEAGAVKRWTLEPERFKLTGGTLEELAGGDPAQNAATTVAVLEGKDRSVRRSAVVLNAAAALVAGGKAASWEDGVAMSNSSLDSGSARNVLERLRSQA